MHPMCPEFPEFPWIQRQNVTITDKREAASYPTFHELNVGQVFYIKDCLYMKISDSFENNNVWNFNDTKCCYLSGDEKIDYIPKCSLTVE